MLNPESQETQRPPATFSPVSEDLVAASSNYFHYILADCPLHTRVALGITLLIFLIANSSKNGRS